MKLEYIEVYENSSDEFDIEHCQIKVKITVGVQKAFSEKPIVAFTNSTVFILGFYIYD